MGANAKRLFYNNDCDAISIYDGGGVGVGEVRWAARQEHRAIKWNRFSFSFCGSRISPLPVARLPKPRAKHTISSDWNCKWRMSRMRSERVAPSKYTHKHNTTKTKRGWWDSRIMEEMRFRMDETWEKLNFLDQIDNILQRTKITLNWEM